MSKHFNAAARWQTVGTEDALERERKTHCKHRHLFPEDARWSINWKGYKCRICPECDRLRMRRKRENPEYRALGVERARRHREKHPDRYKAAWQKNAAKKRQILLDARAGGCVRCGETDESCLDFHHRNPAEKEGHIGEFRKFGMKRLLAEIAKCDVLCANCHRKHHRDERSTYASVD